MIEGKVLEKLVEKLWFLARGNGEVEKLWSWRIALVEKRCNNMLGRLQPSRPLIYTYVL